MHLLIDFFNYYYGPTAPWVSLPFTAVAIMAAYFYLQRKAAIEDEEWTVEGYAAFVGASLVGGFFIFLGFGILPFILLAAIILVPSTYGVHKFAKHSGNSARVKAAKAKTKAIEAKKDALRSELIFITEFEKNFRGEPMTADKYLDEIYYNHDLRRELDIDRYYGTNSKSLRTTVKQALETV